MAKLYVGTYGKYAGGSIKGEWVDLENYPDAEEFFNHCREVHSDEDDPEFMFQDYEDIPSGLYHESMNEDDVQKIYDFLERAEYDRKVIEEYWNDIDSCADPDDIMDKFVGEYESGAEFAEECCSDCENLSDVPDYIKNHIDWEAVWNCELRFDYNKTTNYIFSCN